MFCYQWWWNKVLYIRVKSVKSGSLSRITVGAVLFLSVKSATATLAMLAIRRLSAADISLSCVLYCPRVGAIDFARRPAGRSACGSEMIKDVRAADRPACGLESATVWTSGTTSWLQRQCCEWIFTTDFWNYGSCDGQPPITFSGDVSLHCRKKLFVDTLETLREIKATHGRI